MAAEGGGVGDSLHQRGVNGFQDAAQILVHIAIPKSKHEEAAFRQLLIAHSISHVVGIDIVLTAVDFNNKPVFQTNEINDRTGAWRLTTKVESL